MLHCDIVKNRNGEEIQKYILEGSPSH